MALVSCPECGQQVSTEAVTCPHCGKQLLGTGAPQGAAAMASPVFFASGGTPGPEQLLWDGRPSIALLYGKFLRVMVRFLILVVIGYFAFSYGLPSLEASSPEVRRIIVENETAIDWGIVAVLAIGLLPVLIELPMAIARIRNTHYRVTNQRIVVESGVLSKTLEEIDMRSIDDTLFQQTFLERLFGIGRVMIVSTDKVAPRLALIGIHDPRKTRELIRATAYQVTQRQLFTRQT